MGCCFSRSGGWGAKVSSGSKKLKRPHWKSDKPISAQQLQVHSQATSKTPTLYVQTLFLPYLAFLKILAVWCCFTMPKAQVLIKHHLESSGLLVLFQLTAEPRPNVASLVGDGMNRLRGKNFGIQRRTMAASKVQLVQLSIYSFTSLSLASLSLLCLCCTPELNLLT